jgi:anti-anti-sigma regulatory factor
MNNSCAILVKLPEVFGREEARKLEKELRDKITNDSPNLIADLSRVKKMDLNGMEALLRCVDQVAQRDGALQIRGMSAEAATLLELTRMDCLLAKFPVFGMEAPAYELSTEPVTEAQEVTAEYPVAA